MFLELNLKDASGKKKSCAKIFNYLKIRWFIEKNREENNFYDYYERVFSLEFRVVLNLKECNFNIKGDHYSIFVVYGSNSSRRRRRSRSRSRSSIFSHNM